MKGESNDWNRGVVDVLRVGLDDSRAHLLDCEKVESMKRPEFLTDKHIEFLDSLRESGVTNMFFAGSWLRKSFDLSKEQAGEVLAYWMENFGKDEEPQD